MHAYAAPAASNPATYTAIPGLYSTGVDNSGALLPQGVVDCHYAFASTGGTAFGTSASSPTCPISGIFGATANTTIFPANGAWMAPTTTSQWLLPANPSKFLYDQTKNGTYTWTLIFTLPATLDPTTASFNAQWVVDNYGYITLNGTTISTIPRSAGASAFQRWTPFSATSGFVAGTNTMVFYVTNAAGRGANPTGLQVNFLSSNVNTSTVGGFNAYDTSTTASATSGFITTKISGAPFNVDIIALNAAKNAIDTSFTGSVQVDLVNSSSGGPVNSNGCNASWPVIQTLSPNPTFVTSNNGRLTVNFTEFNAWPNVRVRISDPSTASPIAQGCSTDNFAIRPNSLTITASDSNWSAAGTTRMLSNTSTSGGAVHKAGQAFTLSATALNAVGSVTSNYTGNPNATLTSCLQPSTGCTLGILSTGTWSGTLGTIVSNTASYSDVGAFTMQLVDSTFAAVDAADGSTPAQMDINSSASAGRFVPDHFDLTTSDTPVFATFNTSNAQCSGTVPNRSFTYIGQPFGYLTAPTATLYGRNSSGNTTVNYSNALWHTPIMNDLYANTPNMLLDTSLTTASAVTANNNGTGNVVINTRDMLAYIRNTTTPQASFNANLSLTLTANDTSESTFSGNGVISTNSPAVFNGTGNGIAFDAGNLLYYGRLFISNANGSTALDLPVAIQTQYWNGTNFVTNHADNCTRIVASNVAMGNYQQNLAPCKSAVSISGALIKGLGILLLSAPGASNNGSVDLTINLASASGNTCLTAGGSASPSTSAAQSYLQGKWNGNSYTLNPVARATFGVYTNANQFIFLQELY